MAFSLLAEQFPDLLGDWMCTGTGNRIPDSYTYEGCNYGDFGSHDPTLHWGYRHWIYLIMGYCLALVQIVDIISKINEEDA